MLLAYEICTGRTPGEAKLYSRAASIPKLRTHGNVPRSAGHLQHGSFAERSDHSDHGGGCLDVHPSSERQASSSTDEAKVFLKFDEHNLSSWEHHRKELASLIKSIVLPEDYGRVF